MSDKELLAGLEVKPAVVRRLDLPLPGKATESHNLRTEIVALETTCFRRKPFGNDFQLKGFIAYTLSSFA